MGGSPPSEAKPLNLLMRIISMKRTYASRLVLLAVTLLVTFGSSVFGQEITGTITGTVKDSAGAAVSGATVTITDSEKKGVTRTVTTNESGQFSAPNLGSGFYDVTVEAQNF